MLEQYSQIHNTTKMNTTKILSNKKKASKKKKKITKSPIGFHFNITLIK
jgi:hypothetical protein